MTYRNIKPCHKNTYLGSSTIHLVDVDMISITNSIIIKETEFNIWKLTNIGLFALET